MSMCIHCTYNCICYFRGNFVGEPPFILGEACSNCQGGDSWCKDDLCSRLLTL